VTWPFVVGLLLEAVPGPFFSDETAVIRMRWFVGLKPKAFVGFGGLIVAWGDLAVVVVDELEEEEEELEAVL
jgi:hypothetical protein